MEETSSLNGPRCDKESGICPVSANQGEIDQQHIFPISDNNKSEWNYFFL